MPLVIRNDPLPVILVDRSAFDSPLSARYRRDSLRVITNGRVTGIKVQRTTATPGNPKVGDATSRTARRGLIKKPRLTRERHACTRGEPIDGFRGNTRRLSSRVSAHGCRLNLRPRPRKKKKKKTKEERRRREKGRHLSLSGALTTVRGVSLAIVGSPTSRFATTTRERLARARVLITDKGTNGILSHVNLSAHQYFSAGVKCRENADSDATIERFRK